MTSRHDSPALERLEHLDRQIRRDRIPDGSPGLELAVAVAIPGVTTARRTPVIGLLLVLIGVAAPVAFAAWALGRRNDIVGLALDERFLLGLVVIGLAIVIARLAAIAEIAHAFRRSPGIGGQTAVATFAVVLLAIPVLWVAYRASAARGAVGDIFQGGGDEALFVPEREGSGIDPDSVTTVLLLGGDAGPGRWGLRTDTMILVTIHDASGRTSLLSIPRNLTRLRFPPGSPLAERFPDGFDDLANAVFPYVSGQPELIEHYGRGGLQPEAVALAEALGHSLGIEIDDYALVNMQGFLEVIDAVGGVTLDLDRAVPLPPSIPGGKHPIPESVGPGRVDMDGTLAIAYVRSREGDSDYQRMGRQRQLLAALGSQISPTDAMRGFGQVTGVLEDSVRTSLSAGRFSSLLDRLGEEAAIGESVGLVPPLVEPGSPDYELVRTVVDAIERSVVAGEPSGYAG